MPTLTKLYSMQETTEHNSTDDCWVVIDGKVYDVTSYMEEHPGGDDVFLSAKGKDAQEEFEEAGHSQDARDLMDKFCIGELDPSATTIPEPEIMSKNDDILQKIKDLPVQYWAVPAVGIAVVVGFLYLRK
ncbi:hypothetical protein vseg_001746 [Gypsophila vaccaria]